MEKESTEQKVWITVSETVKTGDYENVKIDAGFSKVYADSDDPIKLIEKGIKNLRKSIEKQTDKIRYKTNRRRL